MTTLRAAHLAEAPIERVWAVFTDIPEAPRMLSAVTGVEILSDGPFGPGYRWRETRTMLGRAATEEMQVTACDEPHSYEVSASSRGTDYRTVFTFSEAPGGTRIDMEFTGSPTGTAARLMDRLFGLMPEGPFVKPMRTDLAELAAVAERPA